MPIKLSIVALAILVLASCIMPNRSMDITGLSPAPLLGIAVDENLTVLDVEPGSPAEEAGIQRGDVLLDLTDEVDKSPTSFRDAEKVKELISSGGVVSLRLQRGDQIIEMTMQVKPPASRPGAATATPLWPPNNLF